MDRADASIAGLPRDHGRADLTVFHAVRKLERNSSNVGEVGSPFHRGRPIRDVARRGITMLQHLRRARRTRAPLVVRSASRYRCRLIALHRRRHASSRLDEVDSHTHRASPRAAFQALSGDSHVRAHRPFFCSTQACRSCDRAAAVNSSRPAAIISNGLIHEHAVVVGVQPEQRQRQQLRIRRVPPSAAAFAHQQRRASVQPVATSSHQGLHKAAPRDRPAMSDQICLTNPAVDRPSR